MLVGRFYSASRVIETWLLLAVLKVPIGGDTLRRVGVGRGGAAVADKCCGNVRQGCYRRAQGGRRVVGRDVLEG